MINLSNKTGKNIIIRPRRKIKNNTIIRKLNFNPSSLNLFVKKLPAPQKNSKENRTTENVNEGRPKNIVNFCKKEISMNINPAPRHAK